MTNSERVGLAMCLGGRDLTEPRPSPDGSMVAFVVRWGANVAIVIVPVSGGPERLLTSEPAPAPGRGLGGGCFDWMPDASAVVYAARDGDLWFQPLSGGPAHRVSDVGEGHRVEAPCVAPDGTRVVAAVDQAEIWCWSIDRSAAPADDRRDRTARRLDDGSADFVFDPYVESCNTMVSWQAWNVPDMPWDASRVQRATLDGSARDEFVPVHAIQQPRTMPDGRRVAVRDDAGWLNVWIDDEPLVDESFEHAGPSWGMGQRSYAVSPDGTQVAFSRNEGGFGRLCVVDVATRAVSEVARGVHGQLGWSGDRVTTLRTGARTPTQIVAYDPATWQRTVLAIGPVAGWEHADLPEPESVVVPHDGTTLFARRYVAGRGRTLCMVHGGPTDQWQVEFMPRVAYWWSRGYDILVPDPRGSTGHGREYQQSLQGEWGRLDVDDTAAIIAYSHSAGWSSPPVTVVTGSSSGGLTVLGVMARHSELVCGGVALYPVADLAVLAAESHRFEAHYPIGLVGPIDDTSRYRDRSPVSHADRIRVPLLVMHGDADPVVPISSTLRFVERVRAAGGDVELVVMEGEGHGFRDPANKRADYEITERFLVRAMDGEPGRAQTSLEGRSPLDM